MLGTEQSQSYSLDQFGELSRTAGEWHPNAVHLLLPDTGQPRAGQGASDDSGSEVDLTGAWSDQGFV
ncbi:hypothetical protein CIB48_g7113 [Xylaria polymorpha]|nr:hypothetical protein CIB48_g7113 [Xylaria polymorpha]